jgi:hypothetical protein
MLNNALQRNCNTVRKTHYLQKIRKDQQILDTSDSCTTSDLSLSMSRHLYWRGAGALHLLLMLLHYAHICGFLGRQHCYRAVPN